MMFCLVRKMVPERLVLGYSALSVLVPAFLFAPALGLIPLFMTGLTLLVLLAQADDPLNPTERGGAGPEDRDGFSDGSSNEAPGLETPGEREAAPGGWRGKKAKLAGAALALVALLVIIFLAYPRPNFVVEALSVPREVIHGDEIVITAEAANTGRAEGSYSVTLFIEDSEVETKEFRLDAGAGELLQFNFPVDYAPGTYPLYLGLGPEQERLEELEGSFQVLKPYIITEFNVPEEIVHGDDIVVSAGVENISSVQIPYGVTLFVNGNEAETRDLNLEAGGRDLLEFDLTGAYGPGSYTFTLGLGPEKTISAGQEYAMRILKPAEFVIRSFNLSSNVINIGDEIEARIRVANIGEIEGDYTVEIKQNDDIIESEDVTLEGESETEVVLPLTIEKPGSHTLTVADYNEALTAYQIERPANGTVLLNKVSGGYGQLRIKNNYSDDNCFVLSRADDPLTPLLAVYVRAESSTTVRGIRDGNYVSYYSFGEDWDSHSKQFTKNVSYGRFEGERQVTTTHQADGSYYYTILENEFGVADLEDPARTESVREEDFPSL